MCVQGGGLGVGRMRGRNSAYLDLVPVEGCWWHLDCVADDGELKHPV